MTWSWISCNCKRTYSRLAVRAGVKSFEDNVAKTGTKKKLIIGDEPIVDNVIPPRTKGMNNFL